MTSCTSKLPLAPRTRAECVPRPCPYTRCRYHLLADSHRFDDAADMPAEESCALDVAEDGPHTLEQIGKILGVSSSGSA